MNDNKELYSLNDIRTVLDNILDKQELKQVIREFIKYKENNNKPTIFQDIPDEPKFKLPEKWCIKASHKVYEWLNINSQTGIHDYGGNPNKQLTEAQLNQYIHYPGYPSQFTTSGLGHQRTRIMDGYTLIGEEDFINYIEEQSFINNTKL